MLPTSEERLFGGGSISLISAVPAGLASLKDKRLEYSILSGDCSPNLLLWILLLLLLSSLNLDFPVGVDK